VIQDVVRLAAEALVKPFEGYARRLPDGSCAAYPDPGTGADPWTIGWGSTGRNIGPDTVWTLERAQTALETHLIQFLVGLFKLSPGLMKEPDRRIAAVLSFVYNCGLGNYRISIFKKRVDAQDWAGAKEEIVKWNKAAGKVMPGLTRRRLAESTFL
jgi:lysozyme